MMVMRLGFHYFILAFAAGVALATLRVSLLVPRWGESLSVAIELPFMLILSWYICGLLLRRRHLKTFQALGMGAFAFALLIVAEIILSLFIFGRSISEHFSLYREVSHQLGLAGQVAFAVFPLLRHK